MEVQAYEYLSQEDWIRALESLSKLLQNKQISKQQAVAWLLARAECLFKLGNHEAVVNDCRSAIKLLSDQCDSETAHKLRKCLVHALFLLKRYSEAELSIREWLSLFKETPDQREVKILLEHLLESGTQQKFETTFKVLDNKFSQSAMLPKIGTRPGSQVTCIYCNLSFADKMDLRTHCQTDTHEMMVMSDEGHDWHWRPPPRGFKSETYVLCENWKDSGSCRYGIQCVQAHGHEELVEWKERFHYREMKLQRAREKELFGKSYTEELLDRWVQSVNPNQLMHEKIEDVCDSCSSPLIATVSSKNSVYQWIFNIQTARPLKAVALLQDTHRNHYSISEIVSGGSKMDLKNNQEWISNVVGVPSAPPIVQHQIVVVFKTNIFGTFRQSVVFDFGGEPVLVKHLCVDVVPDSDLEKIQEIRKEISVSIWERWTSHNSDIVPFTSSLVSYTSNEDWEKTLRSFYPCPRPDTFLLSHATVSEKKFTKNNYRERMHELLFVEEMARYDLIAQYNLKTKLRVVHSYILSPNSMAASTAKYSSNGEFFASFSLGKELSEDTSEGRLILRHCNSVYLFPSSLEKLPRRKVFEALIEDKVKNRIYLRLSAETVQQINLTSKSEIEVQVQFQLNRIPYCEWHYTLDKMPNFKIIFPETYLEPHVPWSPIRHWSRSFDSRLNIKQKEAIMAITTPVNVPLPPILVIGPFGTGKTFTLAQAVKELIKDPANRILLCTHSNSAADLYIKEYLDAWVEEGNENARPLRIYYQKRWVTTVNPVVQKYCIIKHQNNTRNFEIPTLEDIVKHKIIVVTLSTSVYLSTIDLPPGFFTHILLDEAAQAVECETITPLALANENTRIVLAGDHMQLGPDIFSPFAKERNMHISLLERLYDHYPPKFSCKILLCENYRAHESIIHFTSESFYDQKLVSSSKQPIHPKFYPLTFFVTRGEDVQDKNSTAFYNNSEVYEVVERIAELKRNWPGEWGAFGDQSIGVVTPYSDQVFRIRSELRKRRIDNICVERVLNVQGKQFRAIILSTVRTRRTCNNDSKSAEVDYGFLSNSKLLNTAITRAQSLVAVVGDPIALCSVGRCSKVWERFIQICNDNDSLLGITWTQLKLQLDGIELKKIYTLNPLAPEFIPRRYKEMGFPAQPSVVQPPKEPPLIPPSNLNQVVPPPVVPPFPVPPDFPVVSVFLQPPFLYNLSPNVAGFVPPPPNTQLPLANGFHAPPPLRMVNPHGVPLVVPQRPIPPIPGMASPRNINKLRPALNHQTPPPQQIIPSTSNKLIQFMNNVHFPEAQVLNDCVNLLPQHMSLAEMSMQPPNLQERWYLYLKETIGFEAAEKFKYLLHTTTQKGSRITDKNIFGRHTPQSCDSPTFNWYDSPLNQINYNKPVYMREHPHEIPCNGPVPNIMHNLYLANKSNPLYERHPLPLPMYSWAGEPNFNHFNGERHVLHPPEHVNGVVDEQKQLQRHINEEFANLSIGNGNSSDVSEVFKAFTSNKGSQPSCSNISRTSSMPMGEPTSSTSNGPRFYKFFNKNKNK